VIGPSASVSAPPEPEPEEHAARVRATAESVAMTGSFRIIHIFLDVR
jgi:hypothetical protein